MQCDALQCFVLPMCAFEEVTGRTVPGMSDSNVCVLSTHDTCNSKSMTTSSRLPVPCVSAAAADHGMLSAVGPWGHVLDTPCWHSTPTRLAMSSCQLAHLVRGFFTHNKPAPNTLCPERATRLSWPLFPDCHTSCYTAEPSLRPCADVIVAPATRYRDVLTNKAWLLLLLLRWSQRTAAPRQCLEEGQGTRTELCRAAALPVPRWGQGHWWVTDTKGVLHMVLTARMDGLGC